MKLKKAVKSIVAMALCAALTSNTLVLAATNGEPPEPEAGAGTSQESGQSGNPEQLPEDLEQPGKIDENLTDDPNQTMKLREPEITAQVNSDEVRYGGATDFGEFYKTYEIGPNSYKTVYSAVPVAYRDKNGQLQIIDNTLVKDTRPAPEQPKPALLSLFADNASEEPEEIPVYTNEAGPVEISLPEEMEQEVGLSFKSGDCEFEMLPTGGDYTKSLAKENAVRYNDVYDGIDVQYTVTAMGVKEDIILNRFTDKNEFTYRLKTDLAAKLKNGAVNLYYSVSQDTAPVAVIDAPVMTDAAGNESTDVELSLTKVGGDYQITVAADPEWIADPERAFPVKIDPSFAIPPENIKNTTARSGGGGTPFIEERWAAAGYMTRYDLVHYDQDIGNARSFYQIEELDFSAITDPDAITRVVFSLYPYKYGNSADVDQSFTLYQVNGPWQPSGLTWSKAQSLTGSATELETLPAQTYYPKFKFDIKDTFLGWMNDESTNHGLMIKAKYEDSTQGRHGAAFYNYSTNEENQPPTLTVYWGEATGDGEMYVTPRPLFTFTEMDDQTLGEDCVAIYPYGTVEAPAAPAPDGGEAGKSTTVVTYSLLDSNDVEIDSGEVTVKDGASCPDDYPFKQKYGNLVDTKVVQDGNWQAEDATVREVDQVPNLENNVVYHYTASAVTTIETVNEDGTPGDPMVFETSESISDTFILYQVKQRDNIKKLANFYGVSEEQVSSDNHLFQNIVREDDILFIRNPQKNAEIAYQPDGKSSLSDELLKQLLLGRYNHCEYGLEPINLNTGNFLMEQQDVSIPDYNGNFSILRTYNSQGMNFLGSFGRGWQFEYGDRLSKASDGTLLYTRGDGATIPFTRENGEYHAPDGYNLTVKTYELPGEGIAGQKAYEYDITDESQTVRHFDDYGLMTSKTTREGYRTKLEYDEYGNLTSITSPAGKEFKFYCNADGLIEKIEVPNGGVLQYEYDEEFNLVKFTDALGHPTEYTYDADHLLLTATDADGNTFVDNTYDSEGRVTEQLDADNHRSTLEYGETANGGTTTVTDANGNVTVYHYDDQYRTTKIEYPDGTVAEKEYQDGLLSASVDQAGNRTEYQYDSRFNLTELRRFDGETRRFEYNDRNQVVRMVDFDGKVTVYEYSVDGDLQKITQNDGSTITYGYNSHHQPLYMTDAEGHTTAMTYDGPWLATVTDADRNKTEYHYNAHGQVTSVVDADSGITRYAYDLAGRKTMEQAPDGAATNYTFSDGGYVTAIQDPNGSVSEFTYSNTGWILEGLDPLGGKLTMTYDDIGNKLSETDARGITVTYEYDSMNRVSAVTDGDGNTTHYEYDPLGNIGKMIDPNGNVTEYSYDYRFNQPESVTDALGSKTHFTFDLVGNILKQSDPDGSESLFEYDSMNRLSKMTDKAGLASVITYDKDGNILKLSDNSGRETSYTYNTVHQPVEITLPNGGKVSSQYDSLGNLTEQTDAMGRKTSYTYDQVGRVTSVMDALGQKTKYSYDLNGNLLKMLDPKGGETTYQYDALDRLRISADPINSQTVIEYDGSDNMTAVRNALGAQWDYEYNGRNLPETATDPMGSVYRMTYDGNGNSIGTITPDDGRTVNEYDALNRLVKSTDAQGLVTEYSYDSMNRLILQKDNQGGKTAYSYDGAGRLTESKDALDQPTRYEYDVAGNITAITTYDGNKTVYAYDKMGNLVSATDAENKTVTYVYDLNNNLLSKEDHLHRQWKYAYDEINRAVSSTNPAGSSDSYEYDPLGNLTKLTNAAGNSKLFTYDAVSSVTSATDENGNLTAYEYDALGRVVKSTVPDGGVLQYQYDALDRLVKQMDALGNSTTYTYDVMSNQTGVTRPTGGTYQYTYDFHGAVTSMTDPLGAITEYKNDLYARPTEKKLPTGAVYGYEYDLIGRMTKLSQPEGMWDTFAYDAKGNLAKQSDEGTRETSFTYDIMHRLQTATNAEGHTTNYAYNDAGNLSELTTALGYKTSYSYDVLDQVVSVKDPVGKITAFQYDVLGNLVKTTENGKHPTAFAYDNVGNLTGTTNALNQTTGYEYDSMNRLVKETNTAGKVRSYVYDLNGQLLEKVNRLGGVAKFTYDSNGNLTSNADEENREKQYFYDLADRLTSVAEGEIITAYTYDTVGNLTSQTNGEGKTTTYSYDLADRLTSITNPMTQVQKFQYDVSGRLSKKTNPDGTGITYDYDKLDELVSKKSSDKADEQAMYGYDADGRYVTMNDFAGKTDYEYDGVNRITAVNLFNGEKIQYSYDEFGNISKLTYPDNTAVTYTYDALNRMTQIKDRKGKVTTYQYDVAGNMVRVNRPNNTWTTIDYDDEGNVLKLANMGRDLIYGTPANISTFTYTYDLSGFITKEVSKFGYESEMTTTYQYDGRGQLIDVHEVNTASAHDIERKYTYDKAGNRILDEVIRTLDGCKYVTCRTEYTYDAADHMTKMQDWNDSQNWFDGRCLVTNYEYDLNGNLIKSTDAYNKVTGYQYDNENRLKAVKENGTLLMAALYDGNGDRIFKLDRVVDGEQSSQTNCSNHKVDVDMDVLSDVMFIPNGITLANIDKYDLTGYINDVNQEYTQTLMEYGKRGNTVNIYDYGVQRNSGYALGSQLFYAYDGRGSVANLLSAGGQSRQNYVYNEWGRTVYGNTHAGGYLSQPYQYNAEQTDVSTGLQYLRARYYNPNSGRFMQQDSFLGYVDVPVTRNLFTYCGNNPLNYFDPSGNDYHDKWREFYSSSLDQLIKINQQLDNLKKEHATAKTSTQKGKLRDQFEALLKDKMNLRCEINEYIAYFEDYTSSIYRIVTYDVYLPDPVDLEELYYGLNESTQGSIKIKVKGNNIEIIVDVNFVGDDVLIPGTKESFKENVIKGFERWSGTYNDVFGFNTNVQLKVNEAKSGLTVNLIDDAGRSYVDYNGRWSTQGDTYEMNLYDQYSSGKEKDQFWGFDLSYKKKSADDAQRLAQHEMGHFLGLDDAYKDDDYDRPDVKDYDGIMKNSWDLQSKAQDTDIQMILSAFKKDEQQSYITYKYGTKSDAFKPTK